MGFAYIFFIALALAMDAFAIALSTGAYYGRTTPRQQFRLSFHFGLFQFFMPLLGWLGGSEFVKHISEIDHWVACGILVVIGSKMFYEAFNKNSVITRDITKGLSLITLSVATSIDALAVGFTIGIINGNILLPSIIIGFVCSILTLIGMKLGERLSVHFGKRIAALGGVILIFIGLKIVVEHLNLIS
ncbi:MAG: hypothetical protein HW421_996 [Ignavibacteria bacterium]|nr:hypothetical protein [Ignavibacteria bacterium]